MSATKSKTWFSPQTPRRIKDQVAGILGLPTTDRIGTYLGTPIFTTRRTASSYQYLVDNIRKRIEGWQARYLSMAGRATLIKTSVTSVPLYAMQTTLLLKKICHHIDKMSYHFLWGDTDQYRGCHTVNWETITLPKEAGGLGMSSTRHRNKAILMNQAWRLYSNATALWARVLKAKYFPHATVFISPQTSRGSHIWTAISLGVELLLEGMRWIIGDGRSIRVWKDHWFPNGSLWNYIEGPFLPQEDDRRVNSLWSNQEWSFDSLNLPLPTQLQDLFQGILVARYASLTDSFLWPYNKGTCSVKSTSRFLYQRQQVPWNKALWQWIWVSPCPKKIQMFLWKAI